ncbi:MAG: head decoration protein [Betaproteobacteria bacterium]|nr:head decoration protein [Betaproteobacteria bacterium]
MNALNEALNLGDLLKYEDDCLNYSRDLVTVESGQTLELGAVLGRVTTTGKVRRLNPAATDGTEHAAGVLLGAIDAGLADRNDGLLLARHAIVASSAVVWPFEITSEQKATATAQLEARGILIRQSA